MIVFYNPSVETAFGCTFTKGLYGQVTKGQMDKSLQQILNYNNILAVRRDKLRQDPAVRHQASVAQSERGCSTLNAVAVFKMLLTEESFSQTEFV